MLSIDSRKIQDMATYGGFVYASYKGGLVATMDSGKTWIPGGNQFNLPSFTDVKKISFVKTRIFVTTEYNGLYSNALSELPLFPDTFLVVVQDAIGFSADGGRKWATVNSNSYWSATSHVPWVSITYPNNVLDGNITIEVEANPGPPRLGFVEVNAGSKWELIGIQQTGTGGLAELEGAIKLYPNPNTGSFQLDFTNLEGKVERISVIGTSGNTLFERTVAQGESTLKVESSLSPGVYMVRIQTTEGNLVKKVVIH
jgi:hypothetical protein